MSIFFIELCLKIYIDISFLKKYQSFDDFLKEITNQPDEVDVFYLHSY